MLSALGMLFSWNMNCDQRLNPNKTNLVLFSRRYQIETFRLPSLDGRKVPLSCEVKYLGIALDSKLNWKQDTEIRMMKGLNVL